MTYFFDVISLILIVLGIVIDPTTRGVSDSKRAQKYVTFGQQYDYNDLEKEGTWKIG
ncbi:phage holin [Vagococcus elongatus]|uniref:phage holin n=1 Tax=Vagococcus elongatus TaxID=180344 RepID=UPI0014772D64|nr:phage holin [Vagococcus elongatus]